MRRRGHSGHKTNAELETGYAKWCCSRCLLHFANYLQNTTLTYFFKGFISGENILWSSSLVSNSKKIRMKSYLIIMVILFTSIFETKAQSATITFQSDADLTVQIYKPIDRAYNSLVVSDVLKLKKNMAVNYSVDISEFGFVSCRLYDESRCDLLLLPGDHVDLRYINAAPTFSGSNAIGHAYMHNEYTKKGLAYYHGQIDSLICRNISSKIDFDGVDLDLKNKLGNPFMAELKKMSSDNKMSKTFADLMYRDLQYAQQSMLVVEYQNLLAGRVKKYKPSAKDSSEISKRILALYDDPNILNENTLRFNFAYVSNYYAIKWRYLSNENKSALRGNIPATTFGPSICYLSAPVYLQAILFGSQLLEDLKYGVPRLDRKKLMEYLIERFPSSEFIPIIQKRLK